MKMINYRLQTEIENIKQDKQAWFKQYIVQVLESEKPYHAKADYIGLSIKEIDNKIDYLTADIKEMTKIKKSLQNAKAVALEAMASVLGDYGIDRIDGTAISSITITPSKTKTKESLKVINGDELIRLGYFTVSLDEEAVKEAILTNKGEKELSQYAQVINTKEVTPAKLKVNYKRGASADESTELLPPANTQLAA